MKSYDELKAEMEAIQQQIATTQRYIDLRPAVIKAAVELV
jgi:hypothetical protein